MDEDQAESTTSSADAERVRLLARLRHSETTWNRWVRVAWWLFALPLGFASWVATFGNRLARTFGYVMSAALLCIWSAGYVGVVQPQNASSSTDETPAATSSTTSTSVNAPAHPSLATTDTTAVPEATTTTVTTTTLAASVQMPEAATTITAVATTQRTTPPTTSKPTITQKASCYPLSNAGNCYNAGQFCRDADHGRSGIAGNGDAITCQDKNGWRWLAA
jgi:hypothetical protein